VAGLIIGEHFRAREAIARRETTFAKARRQQKAGAGAAHGSASSALAGCNCGVSKIRSEAT